MPIPNDEEKISMRTAAWSGLLVCTLQVLQPGALVGSISGRVAGPFNFFPLAGIEVRTYNVPEKCPGPWTTTDAYGYYLLGDLEEGTYHMRFFDPSGIYMGENYDDLPDIQLQIRNMRRNQGDLSLIPSLIEFPSLQTSMGRQRFHPPCRA